jgi:hypothetical protein
VDSAKQVRQEIGNLVHQIDAQIVVVDGHMDVLATHQKPASYVLQLLGQNVVALFVGFLLIAPIGERMGGGSNGGKAISVGNICHCPA